MIKVRYDAGESRQGNEAVDFMIANVGDVELYAEATPDADDECGTYETLKAEIIRQAKANGIRPEELLFMYFD